MFSPQIASIKCFNNSNNSLSFSKTVYIYLQIVSIFVEIIVNFLFIFFHKLTDLLYKKALDASQQPSHNIKMLPF